MSGAGRAMDDIRHFEQNRSFLGRGPTPISFGSSSQSPSPSGAEPGRQAPPPSFECQKPSSHHNLDDATDEEISTICSSILRFRFRGGRHHNNVLASCSHSGISKRDRNGHGSRLRRKLPALSIPHGSPSSSDTDDSYMPPRLELESARSGFFEDLISKGRVIRRVDSSSTCSSSPSPRQSPANA